MASAISYYAGGVDNAAPNRNICELWDGAAGTYTRYSPAGVVVETRPLTDDEKVTLNG